MPALPNWRDVPKSSSNIIKTIEVSRRNFLLCSTAAAFVAGRASAATAGFTQDNILQRDFEARQASEAVQAQGAGTAQLPFTTHFSLITGTGQSNLQGDQNAWANAAPPLYGNVMLGNGTRPLISSIKDPNANLFQPVGGPTIQPLVSVNQDATDGLPVTVNQGGFDGVTGATFAISPKNVLTLTQPAGNMHQLVDGVLVTTPVGGASALAFDLTQIFAPGMGVWFTNVTGTQQAEGINIQSLLKVEAVTARTMTIASGGFGYAGISSTPISIFATNNFGVFGEDACVTQANEYSALASAAGALPAGKVFGVLNGAVAGTTIAELSPGATPNLYHRVIDGVTRFTAAAAALGKTTSVVVDVYEQGNADIGHQTSQAAYTAGLQAIYSGHRTAYPAITGQTRPPVFMISQTSGFDLSKNDFGNNAVSMAQLLFATSGQNPDAYCFGPTYFAPNQGVHETPNGQRWKGAMRAKILYRILNLNQAWLPLYPTLVSYLGNQILLEFHVPVGGLQFRPAFKFGEPTVYPDAGFQATDANGLNPVTAVKITGGYSIFLQFARNFVSAPRVQYADGTNHDGMGNLYDGDTAVSAEIFTYTPFAGEPPIDDIPAFTDTVLTGKTFPSPVGQPYALFNPCCVFNVMAVPA
jgi:hypothetical protein